MNDSFPPDCPPRLPFRPPEIVRSLASFLGGVLLPGFCFLLASAGSPDAPDWQSGQFDAYASLLLGGNRTWVFYPFLAYSVACLLVVLLHPETAARYFLLRLGVYSGVILALHFVFVLGVALLDIHDLKSWRFIASTIVGIPLLSLIAVAVPFVGWLFFWVLVRLWQRYRIVMGLLAAALAFCPVGMIIAIGISDARGGDLGEVLGPILFAPVGLFVIGSLVSAPSWAAAVYAYQSMRIMRLHGGRQLRLWQFFVIFTWIAAYFATWRAAILLMLEAYAQLPVEPPEDCYIATAAARGHRRFVGSREVVCRDGSIRHVNMQLAYFKCGELAIKVTWPKLHRIIRIAYDTLGPPVARLLIYPLMADLVFLALKPLEWLTRAVLTGLLGDTLCIARKMYH